MMREETIWIWGREMTLPMVFDCYEGEKVLPYQRAALRWFLEDLTPLNAALPAVEEYCRAVDWEEFGDRPVENIFRYVMPQQIFVKRTDDDSRVVGLLCAYRFDAENGLAVVFRNEALERVGTQNIVL